MANICLITDQCFVKSICICKLNCIPKHYIKVNIVTTTILLRLTQRFTTLHFKATSHIYNLEATLFNPVALSGIIQSPIYITYLMQLFMSFEYGSYLQLSYMSLYTAFALSAGFVVSIMNTNLHHKVKYETLARHSWTNIVFCRWSKLDE